MMYYRLKKIYLGFLAPAIVGFIAFYAMRSYGLPNYFQGQQMAFVAPAIFLMAILCTVAGPIFYRSLFAYKQRLLLSVPRSTLFKFERNLTCMTLVSVYLALASCFLQLPRFYRVATLLTAIYAVYYHYPSKRRIAFDQRLFRVRGTALVD
jgi:hypothetical protein